MRQDTRLLRVVGITVAYATLETLNGGAGVLAESAAHHAPGDLVALEADAIVALAGPRAQNRFRPLSPSAERRTWRSGGWWRDHENAQNHLGTLFLTRHGEPIMPGEMVEIDAERSAELSRLFEDTIKKTDALVEAYWPQIRRVAAALSAGRLLTEADLDELIVGDHPLDQLLRAEAGDHT